MFQSTPPVRGATGVGFDQARYHDVSIHAPRAGSDKAGTFSHPTVTVSIHAPRAGSDQPVSLPFT